MDRQTFRLTALIAVLALSAGTLSARTSAAVMMSIEPMTKGLSLNKEQKAQVKALDESKREEHQGLHAKMEKDAKALKALIKRKASDEELSQATAVLKADHRAIMNARMAHHEALQALLTPLQNAKLAMKMGEGLRGDESGPRMGFGIGVGVGF